MLKALEEKGQITRKVKIMSLWIEMFKVTKYDLSDILMNKKLKVFTKTSPLLATSCNISSATNTDKEEEEILANLENYLLINVLVPLYNYFMKLSINEELFKICVIGKFPEDDIFRRGSKIKFIWPLKLYNLINPLIPIISACTSILET